MHTQSHTRSQITITNTPQHTHTYNLSPSHTHHITHKIIYAIISHIPRRLIECHYNNQIEIRFLTSSEAHHIPGTRQTLPDDCGLSWVSSLSCQFSGPLLLELSCKLRAISSWLGTKDAGKKVRTEVLGYQLKFTRNVLNLFSLSPTPIYVISPCILSHGFLPIKLWKGLSRSSFVWFLLKTFWFTISPMFLS